MLLLDGEVARPLGGGAIGVDREERHGEVRELAVGVGEVSEGVGVCVGGVERLDQDPWLGGAEGAVLCSAGELGRCRVWNGSVVKRSWMSVSAGSVSSDGAEDQHGPPLVGRGGRSRVAR